MLPQGMAMAQLQGPQDPKGCRQETPKKVFQSLGVTFPPCPWGWAADTDAHQSWMQARTLGLKHTYGKSHTRGFKWHLPNEDQASILGTVCSSKLRKRHLGCFS